MCLSLTFPSCLSTSLVSIHHVASEAHSFHSPQTLALLQKKIDPAVNLISMILCRAFSFTALHRAKQTWLFHTERSPCSRQDKTTCWCKNVLKENMTGIRLHYKMASDIQSLWKFRIWDLHPTKYPWICSMWVGDIL